MDTTPSNSAAPKPTSVAGWVFGGLSFIPLIGVIFGVVAIIFGATKKVRGQIFLGAAGILFSLLLYGGLYYLSYVATTGTITELRIPLLQQVMTSDAGQIALYKIQHGKLPAKLDDLRGSSSTDVIILVDPWGTELKYEPLSNGHFRLISAGPDRKFGTSDDVSRAF